MKPSVPLQSESTLKFKLRALFFIGSRKTRTARTLQGHCLWNRVTGDLNSLDCFSTTLGPKAKGKV